MSRYHGMLPEAYWLFHDFWFIGLSSELFNLYEALAKIHDKWKCIHNFPWLFKRYFVSMIFKNLCTKINLTFKLHFFFMSGSFMNVYLFIWKPGWGGEGVGFSLLPSCLSVMAGPSFESPCSPPTWVVGFRDFSLWNIPGCPFSGFNLVLCCAGLFVAIFFLVLFKTFYQP